MVRRAVCHTGDGRSRKKTLLVSISAAAGIPQQEALSDSPESQAHSARDSRASDDDHHDPESPLRHDATSSHEGTGASSEYSPPLRTWDEVHEPMGTPGDRTPPPSPKTPVFSPLPYSPSSSAEVERMIKRFNNGRGTIAHARHQPASPHIADQCGSAAHGSKVQTKEWCGEAVIPLTHSPTPTPFHPLPAQELKRYPWATPPRPPPAQWTRSLGPPHREAQKHGYGMQDAVGTQTPPPLAACLPVSSTQFPNARRRGARTSEHMVRSHRSRP